MLYLGFARIWNHSQRDWDFTYLFEEGAVKLLICWTEFSEGMKFLFDNALVIDEMLRN